MTTLIEILDTSVKIGLGALISGITTYWVTINKHSHELKHELLRRRRVILEDVAEQIEGVYHGYLLYSGDVLRRIRCHEAGDKWPDAYESTLRLKYDNVLEKAEENRGQTTI